MPAVVTRALMIVLCGVGGVSSAAEPRAARSVHLGYEAADATAFSVEMTILASTPGSYFMAAGWNTGYFGLQELADHRKVVIFSVWDPTAGDDPNAVGEKDRVECLAHSPDMRIKRFGGEGTGGQCMGDFDWQLGAPVRFGVTATVEGDTTAYAGYVQAPGGEGWKHLVTFRTRTGGQPLRGLYSFVEDFRRDGRSPNEVRRARFGAGWARTVDGTWAPLRRARFTASGAEWEAKDSIDAGLDTGQFLLATGGDTRPSRALLSTLECQAAEEPPEAVERLARVAP